MQAAVGGGHARDLNSLMASEPTLSSLALLAASSSAQDPGPADARGDGEGGGQPGTKEQARRHFIRTLHKAIDQSDIVVLVLDARDPEGCRSQLVEEEVTRGEESGVE